MGEPSKMDAFNARLRSIHGALEAQDQRNRTVISARTVGLVAMLDVGWRVWAREDGVDMRVDHRGDARGGIIVEVTGARWADEDGEIHDERRFRCADPVSGAQVVLGEAQIDPDRIDRFDRWETWRLIGLLAETLVVKRGSRRKSLLEGEHERLRTVADIARLARAVTVPGMAVA